MQSKLHYIKSHYMRIHYMKLHYTNLHYVQTLCQFIIRNFIMCKCTSSLVCCYLYCNEVFFYREPVSNQSVSITCLIFYKMNSDYQSQMQNILEKLGLNSLTEQFQEQKITPDIVCVLSLYECHQLGVNTSSAIMAL